MGIFAYDGIVPVVDPTAFIHPDATLIGDVIIGAGCYVGPNASLRGDFGRLVMHEGANLQDNCVVHCFPERDTVIEVDGHIGHGAVLHGCHVGRNALVGMGAVVMDGAEIGAECIIGALAFIPANQKIPPRSLVTGIPGRIMRSVSDKEIAWKSNGTRQYQLMAQRCRASLVQVQPLSAPEPDRRRHSNAAAIPLQAYRARGE